MTCSTLRSRPVARHLLVLAALPLLTACGAQDDAAAPTTTTTVTAPASPAPTETASPTPTDTATTSCPATGETVPDGAVTAAVDTTSLPNGGDLTGNPQDGPATVWISSTGSERRLGVVTGGGVVSSVPIDSASPVGTSALVANLDGVGPVEVLLDDNRTTLLYAVVDCALQPVLGPDGQPFAFDRGFRGNGTGVGCSGSSADGARSLLGLNLHSDRTPPNLTSTTIVLDGLTASIGTSLDTDLGGADGQENPQVEASGAVTCDTLTMASNGLAEPGR